MKNHRYTIMVLVGLALWLGSTAYFGWNDKPESPAESVFDTISMVLIYWGIIGDVLTNLTIVKKTYMTIENAKVQVNEDKENQNLDISVTEDHA